MTDLEITRLCAEAIGYKFDEATQTVYYTLDNGDMPGRNIDSITEDYNPLKNDAQAMALVKECRLRIIEQSEFNPAGWMALIDMDTHNGVNEHFDSVNPDLNRAICECVANMQQSKHG